MRILRFLISRRKYYKYFKNFLMYCVKLYQKTKKINTKYIDICYWYNAIKTHFEKVTLSRISNRSYPKRNFFLYVSSYNDVRLLHYTHS